MAMMNSSGASNEQKVQRLRTLIAAAATTEDELQFQVRRLDVHVKPRTEEEAEYHAELRHGYEQAAFYVRTMKRYQEGRLERLLGGERLEDVEEEEGDGSINEGGVSQPYHG